MFLPASVKANNLKRAVYLSAATMLGLLLGFIVFALIAIAYLKLFMIEGGVWPFRTVSSLLLSLEIAFLAAGTVGGFFLGKFWWRMVYVKRIWARKRARR